ncbi:unnamed protein product [Caenorhabditis angaria]|uniref:Uncharacterized protein n=1 Tax=Caenorhabditis angaria TaxID=860376 RepID=A0A9P1NAZ9_9PELO|nr:unnamed protein product [Caenorhabditis angaria]
MLSFKILSIHKFIYKKNTMVNIQRVHISGLVFRLPNISNSIFWNVTNPDEVLYYGAKPNLIDIGPYTYAETEFKDFVEFRNNDKEIFYQNNKTWIFDKSRSCEDCNFDDVFIMANPSYMTTVFMQIQNPSPAIVTLGMNFLTLLLGEQPLRTVSGSGTLFVGYSDPLVDLVNSQFTKIVMNILGNPIALPDIVDGGFFPHYNHTCDGNYTIKTGKDNTDNTALIQTWDGITHLSWWNSESTRDIRNSGDGSFQKPGLKKTDKLKQFQSFVCRTYDLAYEEQGDTISGIPTLTFIIPDDTYDSIKNPGYRYENFEQVNYFPTWPCGANHTKQPNGNCALVDCSQFDNFCSNCCDGAHVNNTYVLPPGVIPQRCLPGQNKLVPFGAILSAPHFYGSPDDVTNSLIGLKPDAEKHAPGRFYINPTTGSTVGGQFRMQLTVPIFNSPSWILMSNSPNAFIPEFWLELKVETRDYALDYIRFNVVTVPNIIMGVGIGLTAISVIAALIWIFFYCRRKRSVTPIITTKRKINEKEIAWIAE